MAERESEIIQQLNKNLPTPPGESVEYDLRIRKFCLWGVFISICLSYGFSIIFCDSFEFLENSMPLLNSRIEFIRSQDNFSLKYFISTVVFGVFVVLFVVGYFVVEYWRRVVFLEKCKPATSDTIIVMFLQALIAVAFFYIAFVSVPEAYDPRWPGMSRILLWPVFPAWGISVLWMVSVVLFSLIVGTFKFIYIRGGKSG